jgi:hypothetical protein
MKPKAELKTSIACERVILWMKLCSSNSLEPMYSCAYSNVPVVMSSREIILDIVHLYLLFNINRTGPVPRSTPHVYVPIHLQNDPLKAMSANPHARQAPHITGRATTKLATRLDRDICALL